MKAPFSLSIPADLWSRIVDHAAGLGIAPSDLIVSLLAMPLEVITRAVPLKCETCGTPWVAHSSDCSRDSFRPGWSRIET